MRRLFSREFVLILIPALLVVVAAFWFAARYVKPAPPNKFVISTASKGAPYYELALRYQELIKKNGVDAEIRISDGSFDNLKKLLDPNSDVEAGILQGGISNKTEAPTLNSMGRLLTEPVWIFYRGEERIERLTQLKGKRILTGPAGGGTDFLARKLLAANGITAENSTLISMSLPDYIQAFETSAADAGFLVLGAEARTVQRLLRQPNVKLMNLAQADALTQRFPFLNRITLRQGVVDFANNIPPEDTTMVATQAALVVREDLHPALVNLLSQSIFSVQGQPALTATGEAKLFPLTTTALLGEDPEFPMSPEAARVYKSGATFLQRVFPFWLANLLERAVVLIVPLIGILFPLFKVVPFLYNWRMKQRILNWYRKLKVLERDLHSPATAAFLAEKEQELDHIEDSVGRISLPVQFQADLYNLRDHVDVVRRRIAQLRTGAARQTFSGTPQYAN